MPLNVDLLKHSKRLLEEQQVATQISSVELRRSISSSYYSAWHGVCDAIAARFHPELSHKLNRRPAHAGAKIAATNMLANKKSWHAGDCSENMAKFCINFLNLQRLRHKADYDTKFQPRIQDTIDAYNCASRIDRFITDESSDCQYFHSFVLQCLEVKFKDRDGD